MIACTDLEIRVGYRPLFRNLSFTVPAQQSLAVLGPNGCGKTTLLRCLAGLIRPTRGTVKTSAATTYYLSAHPSLYLDQSVLRQLEFMCNAFGITPSLSAVLQALEHVGISRTRANQVVRSLSTGQKRRLTLALLPLVKPKMILADEPTNGLDDDGIKIASLLFQNSMQEGASLILATHDKALAATCTAQINLQAMPS